MKTAVVVVVLWVSAVGQAVFSGSASFSGAAGYGASSLGGPLTYGARTDTCVHGYSTNPPTVAPFYDPAHETCTPGATTGQLGSALVFQMGDSDPIPFLRLDDATTPAVVNTSFTDPDFNSYSVFVTDQSTNVATNVWNMGSAGSHDAFGLGTSKDTLLTFNNTGSVPYLVHVIPERLFAHACSVANPCIVKSRIHGASCDPGTTCSNTQITNGEVSFSRKSSDAPNTFYEATLPKIYKTTFTSSVDGSGFPTGTGDTVSRTLYVDFSSDSGGVIPCHIVPSDYVSTWAGTFSVSNDGAVTIASAGGGSYQSIGNGAGGPQAVTSDVFIKPVNNNPGTNNRYAFRASSGTTSGTEPNWAVSCPAEGNTCTDGSVTWTNIGIVNGQEQGFDVLHFDPTRGCSRQNSLISKVYRGTNQGVNWPSAGTPDPSGQWITDDAVVCYRMGGSNCGTGGTVNLTDAFTLHGAGQRFQSRYGSMGPSGSTVAPQPASCVLPIPYTTFANWPNTAWVSGTAYTTGKYVSDPTDHNYYKALHDVTSSTQPHSDATNWQYASEFCYNYIIDWHSNIIRPILEIGPQYGGDSHSITGYLYDMRGGRRWTHRYDQPNCQNTTDDCAGKYVGAPNPGIPLLPNATDFDSHPSYRNAGTLDQQPIFELTALVPMWGGVGIRSACGGGSGVGGYCAAGTDELYATSSDGTQAMYRFGHNYCTGSNAAFQIQNCIGVVSQDGKMLAWGSDFMNTRGDVTGSATCAHPLRAQYQPKANGCTALNDYVMPIGNNASSDIFKVTSVGGAVQGTCAAGQVQIAATLPSWNTSCTNAGEVCTDANGIEFTNQGPNTCRGDIGLMDVLSAH
jgi:hypothetical protein